MALEVRYATCAHAQLSELKANALASPNSLHGALWEAMKKAINDVIASEDHALKPQFALKDDLAGIRRVKVMKRHRVFFIASSTKKAARVLCLGFRKEGDKNDAYRDLRRRLARGEFDTTFAELGMKRP